MHFEENELAALEEPADLSEAAQAVESALFAAISQRRSKNDVCVQLEQSNLTDQGMRELAELQHIQLQNANGTSKPRAQLCRELYDLLAQVYQEHATDIEDSRDPKDVKDIKQIV